MKEKIDKNGLIGTITFHGILLLVLILCGYTSSTPEPKEQGIMVALGNTDSGLGNTRASRAKRINPKRTASTKHLNLNTKSLSRAKAKILTQDFEDAPVIKKSKKKKLIQKKTKKKKGLTEKQIRERKNRAEKEHKDRLEKQRIQNEKLEQKRAEDERRIKEELKRKHEEQERIKQEREKKKREEEEKIRQAKIANINKKSKSVFGKKTGDNSGNSGDGKGFGNMGKLHGSIDGDYHGKGTGKNGVSYSLNGRTATMIVKPKTTFQKSGKVVVTIFVNTSGKVTRAIAGARGTTTHEAQLHKLAEQAALKTLFDVNRKAAATQKGTITYIFIVR